MYLVYSASFPQAKQWSILNHAHINIHRLIEKFIEYQYECIDWDTLINEFVSSV